MFDSQRLELSCALVTFLLAPLATAQRTHFAHPDGTTHWYELVEVPQGIDWLSAHRAAAEAGGYLATITSRAENERVARLVPGRAFAAHPRLGWLGPWLGGVQPAGSPEPAGGWMWGETDVFGLRNWSAGFPRDASGADRICLGGASGGPASTWADAAAATRLPGYVIEYSGSRVPQTLGLQRDLHGATAGYTLLNPLFSKETHLVDSRGRRVHSWRSQYLPGVAARLLPSGDLLRAGRLSNPWFQAGGVGGIVEVFDWAGKRTWSYQLSSQQDCQHHDVIQLPSGNLLLLAWELKSKPEALAAGRDPALLHEGVLWPEKIVEVKPSSSGGIVVWEWRVWDHLVQDFDKAKPNYGVVERHPELIDLNYAISGAADWLHANSLAYHPKLDQILISVRSFDEIWIIDHSTTTKQAASHKGGRSGKGGDLLYRWGNPLTMRAAGTQQLFRQHDAHWVPPGLPGEGNILVFNNGNGRPGKPYSRVDELVPPKVDSRGNYARSGSTWGPAAPVWSYADPVPTQLFSGFVSGAQRLSSGNTLVCAGAQGRIFEVTRAGATVWQYTNPEASGALAQQGDIVEGNEVFRAPRYAPGYAGLRGKTLTPGAPLERYAAGLLANGSRLRARARIGETVTFELQGAARDRNRTYQLATSATPGQLAVDFRFVGLGVDPLLSLSLTNGAPTVFRGYAGRLDGAARARAFLALPSLPQLVGVELHTAFVVVDPLRRSSLGTVSNTVVVGISR